MTFSSGLKNQLTEKFSERVRFNEPMAVHTTFRVGGPADAFVTAMDATEIIFLIQWAAEHHLPYLMVGRGSNLLVTDKGIRGVVISMAGSLAGIEQRGFAGISAMAGAGLGALCRFAIANGLGGLNFAMGIPGSVGGAIRMNAGAWEGSMGQILTGIRIIRPDGTIGFMDKKLMKFSYRSLAFCPESGLELSACVILEGVFALTSQDPDMLKTEADALLAARKKSQPVSLASAGSFFKNPVDQEPAGRLIDLAGCKGLSVGDAQISPQHANFIVNHGRASARDILRLMRMVQETVFQKFNILLEPEVEIVGDESTEKKSV